MFFRLGSLPLCGPDEPRYARIAEEMGNRGDWVTPVLEGKPWLEKPPLYYWIAIPFYSLFENHEVAARIGSALCALIASFAIFWLGVSRWSQRAGFVAAASLLTSLGFIGFGRSASTDMPFTCCLTLFFAILLSGSDSANRKAGYLRTLVAYACLGLAVLAKGPVAIILAGGILLCVWYLDERGGLFRTWMILPGTIITALVSIPWFWLAFKQNGFAFIATFFINHNLARYTTDIHHHSQPFAYYIPVLLGLLFPWTSWLPLLFSRSLLKEIRRWREWDRRMVFLTCWFVFPILFFSISDSKLAGYILPSLPPLALILGIAISNISTGLRLKTSAIVEIILTLGMAVAAPLAFDREYGGAWKTGLLISVAIVVPAIFSIALKMRGRCLQAMRATMVQGILIVLALAQFAFPVLGAYHSTRDIALRALELRQQGEAIITYRFFHHTLLYYTGYQVQEKLDDPDSLLRFAQQHRSFLLVAKADRVKEIQGMDIASTLLAEQGDIRLLRIGESGLPISSNRKAYREFELGTVDGTDFHFSEKPVFVF